MTFDEFSRVAQEAFQNVPEAYREGVEGVTTVEGVEAHPELPDVVTLGECVTQAFHSEWQGPDTTRSRVILYYGSFRQMADGDPDFDWDRELWETLTHELQHHLESLADEDALEAMDYAVDESFKRERGEPFDPWYFQRGEPVGEGAYRVEDEVYIERGLTAEEFDRVEEIEFTWQDQSYRLARPQELGDIHFIVVDGIEPHLQIVLVRSASWSRRLRGLLCSGGPTVLESGAQARRVVDVLYFAYGSNLCFRRLKARVPGARALGAALLRDHELRWHKKGDDGSGKCSIVHVGGDAVVHGALFAIPETEKPALDRAEGSGYNDVAVSVESTQGDVTAKTYVAHESATDDTRQPYSWYRALVISGAASQGLPQAYVETLRLVDAVDDPDAEREQKHRAFLPCGGSG